MWTRPCFMAALLLALAGCAAPSGGTSVDGGAFRPLPTYAATPRPAPDDSSMREAAERAHARYADLRDGENADYIPALAEVDSELFSISIVTVDGESIDVGDADAMFSIQSISKAFVLALAMQELGDDAILDRVGVNATGQQFNSIIAIEMIQERSANSLVNAGAIATTSLVPGATADAKWNTIVRGLSDFAGRRLTVNEPVCESELATNQRNQAIGKLLEAYGRIYDDPTESVNVYTKQCALNVNSHDLAVMAATLANAGVNPVTGAQVIDAAHVPNVLAVMATAGLYEESGTWLYRVGLPAKSGVGGGIVAVAPGRFGIAAFSPRLDEAGNSIRAQHAIRDIAEQLGANVFLPATN